MNKWINDTRPNNQNNNNPTTNQPTQQMEQVKNMFYRPRLINNHNQIYDNNTILPLKYKQCSKAFDADVESPYFTPNTKQHPKSMSPLTIQTYPSKPTSIPNPNPIPNTNIQEQLYSENV